VVATTVPIPKEVSEVTTPEIIKGGLYYTPRVDIYETPEEIVVLCDLPGVLPENVELKFEKGELSLYGKVVPQGMPGRQPTPNTGNQAARRRPLRERRDQPCLALFPEKRNRREWPRETAAC
jgi:hypothetical protein